MGNVPFLYLLKTPKNLQFYVLRVYEMRRMSVKWVNLLVNFSFILYIPYDPSFREIKKLINIQLAYQCENN